jgi:pimeloyl-ACP methyl ester carboxylesterase
MRLNEDVDKTTVGCRRCFRFDCERRCHSLSTIDGDIGTRSRDARRHRWAQATYPLCRTSGCKANRSFRSGRRRFLERLDRRSCAYDRAGLGWSEPGPGPRTLKQEVFELHALLKAVRISGPLVLVGQSMGALNVRLYTKEYGDDVAGIVFVDPAGESTMLYSLTAKRWMELREQARGRTVPPAQASGQPSTGYRAEDDYLGDEAQLLYLDRQKNPTPFDDRPLFVLAAGKRPPPPGMTEKTYKDIRLEIDKDRTEAAALSKSSKFVLDRNSGHNIQLDDPKAVAEAVAEVVLAAKDHTKLGR